MKKIPEILVTAGPLQGRRFAVKAGGLRLGRSSTCEIALADPALSRNHCLFEVRDGELWATDLASANGTLVNGVALGTDSQRLAAGDVVEVGASRLVLVDVDALPPSALNAETPPAALPRARLNAAPPPAASALLKGVFLWAVALASVAAATVLVFSRGKRRAPASPPARASAPEPSAAPEAPAPEQPPPAAPAPKPAPAPAPVPPAPPPPASVRPAAEPPPRPARAAGRLEIITSPAGAAVSIDGRPAGETRRAASEANSSLVLELEDLSVGGHLVQVFRDGYREAVRRVEVKKDETARLFVRLARVFRADTEIETIRGVYRGVLVEKDARGNLILETVPGVRQTFLRDEIRKVTSLAK